jgi:phosphohistidine phosphatase
VILWLLRHAKTVPDPPAGKTDHDRPLAPRGRRDADALGKRLADPGFGPAELPALVLCSTATRTVQTAERVLAALDHPPPVEYRRSLYGASPEQVLDELRGVEEGVPSVMVVGHNPTAHDLVTSLGRDGKGPTSFPTCALAVYRLPVSRWPEVAAGTATLLGLYAPPF